MPKKQRKALVLCFNRPAITQANDLNKDVTSQAIRWRMHIKASRQQVYDCLNTNEGRAAFWAESAIEQDERISFRFINGYEHESQILARINAQLFEVQYFGSPVKFELFDDGAWGTDLVLTHTGVKAEEWHQVHAGWLNVLFPLKAWLEHGVDLRNHDPSRTWNQGYADQ